MSFSSYSSSVASPSNSPMQINKGASSARLATPIAPLSINTPAASRRRDSQSNPGFEFSSAVQHRRRSIERPSAYVSDADLWGLDDVPYLREAPAPPRSAEQWLAKPRQAPATAGYGRRSSTMRIESKSIKK